MTIKVIHWMFHSDWPESDVAAALPLAHVLHLGLRCEDAREGMVSFGGVFVGNSGNRVEVVSLIFKKVARVKLHNNSQYPFSVHTCRVLHLLWNLGLVDFTFIWMFHHLAHLRLRFCQIPMIPSRIGQTIEHSKLKSTLTSPQVLYGTSCTYIDYPIHVQGDHSACAKPPVDFKTKVTLWPGQARADQAKAELLSWSQPEVYTSWMVTLYVVCYSD